MSTSSNTILLNNGQTGLSGLPALQSLMSAFQESPQKNCLVIHFHGGLVSEQDGIAMATRLLPVYLEAGGYPLFLIWKSGFLEVLKEHWFEIVREELFAVLRDRVLQFICGKLDQPEGKRGEAVDVPPRSEIEIEIKAPKGDEPFAHFEPLTNDLAEDLTSTETQQFEHLLEKDQALSNAVNSLRRPNRPQLDPKIEADLARPPDDGQKGLLSAFLVGAGVRILARAVRRLATGRDHGIYATVVEEVARELNGEALGGGVWKQMKQITHEAFMGPPETHGGAALLKELTQVHQAGHRPRIILVGHSAGSIFICHLLQQAAVLPADMKLEIILLAPACSFDLLDRALAEAGDRVARFRSFGLSDVLERRDAILSPVYLRSLLYLVSGLLEDSVDHPLVGMQRYHSGAAPFHKEKFPEIDRVLAKLAGQPSSWVWSESGAGDGLNCLARNHGKFDSDHQTLHSLAALIRQEVRS